jgi:glutaredoxin 3
MKVQIYTTSYCGYCSAAKILLDKRGVSYEEIDCTRDPSTRLWLVEQTGRRTVPQVFIGGVPIGGYDDLSRLDDAGELARILAGELAPTPLDLARAPK